MNIRFDGKMLRNGPICNLLREGEKNADTVNIIGPAMYGDLDLTVLNWSMVGNYSSYEESAEQVLQKTVDGDELTLIWVPDETFTAHAGGLDLVLVASDSAGNVVLKVLGEYSLRVSRANRKVPSAIASSLEKMVNTVVQSLATVLGYKNSAEDAAANASSSELKAAESAKSSSLHANASAQSAANARASEMNAAASESAAKKAAQKAGEAASQVINAQVEEKLTEMRQINASVQANKTDAQTAAETAVNAKNLAQQAQTGAEAAVVSANGGAEAAKGYAEQAKDYANKAAAGAAAATFQYGYDADGYWSLIQTVSE